MYMNLGSYKMKLYIRSKKDIELSSAEIQRVLIESMTYNSRLKSLGIDTVITFKFEK